MRPSAEVFINGKSVGTTPLPPRELAPGIYRVRLVNQELGAERRGVGGEAGDRAASVIPTDGWSARELAKRDVGLPCCDGGAATSDRRSAAGGAGLPVVSNPHDALFRVVFSDPANAEGELRAVLPAALSACIDWRTLRHEAGSFVDDELRARHPDVLMSATVAGREVLLYLLLEHQSSADPLMALRMLRYTMRIWERVLQHEPARRTLPVVIPLVVHNGASPWRGSRRSPRRCGILWRRRRSEFPRCARGSRGSDPEWRRRS